MAAPRRADVPCLALAHHPGDPADAASIPILAHLPAKPGDVCALELHIVTAVDNTTDAKVPQTCNEKLCLAVFGIMQEVRAGHTLHVAHSYKTAFVEGLMSGAWSQGHDVGGMLVLVGLQ